MQILNQQEREQIAFYRRLKISLRDIAKRLDRNVSVISRELQRNRDRDGRYLPAAAQTKADRRASKTNKRKLETNEDLHDWVERKLRAGWSPELIAGRLKEDSPKSLAGARVSHEQIYEYIYQGHGRWQGWYHYLHRKHAKRRRQQDRRKQAKTLIKERVSIHDRPGVIDQRQRFGDWESDLALFRKQKTALSVQYERKAMLIRMHKIAGKTADENEQAITQALESVPSELAQSLTQDNGPEGTCHMKIRDTFHLETFFCDPYCAWQKGGVENAIGLIRRYLPKTTDLATISDAELLAIQERLNNRPRKKLHFSPPTKSSVVH